MPIALIWSVNDDLYDTAYSYHMAAAMEGSSDLTHFNDTRAEAVAGLVAGGIKSAKLPLPSEVK